MIRLPRTLQQIHTFEKDGVWYVANLQTGDLLQIDSLTADILALCRTDDNVSILEKFRDKYSEGEVLETLRTLKDDIAVLLFEPEQDLISTTERKLRLFIPHGFMQYKEILSPTTNVGIYKLLLALAKYTEVFVEIDNDETAIEQREQLEALGVRFVSDLFKSENQGIYASNHFIIDSCDGILALSPHPYEELNYFRHNTIPVVSRIYSDKNLRESTINKALSHHALRRNFDSVCPDTPWIVDELDVLTSSCLEGFHTIPNGIDMDVYFPQNHQQAREAVASIVDRNDILDVPFIGILNGCQPQNSIGMIEALARQHKDVFFVVLDPIFLNHRAQQVRNVFYINLQQPEDTVALPWIYSACEFVIFPTVIGTSFSMVIEVLACGVPLLVLNSTTLLKDLAESMVSVPFARNDTTGKFTIPTAAISEQIDTLLNTPGMLETLSIKARQIAESYSWEKTAERFVQLFTKLNERKVE